MSRYFLFIALAGGIFISSCKKYPVDEPIIPKKPAPVDSNNLYHFIGQVDTTLFKLYDGLNGYTNTVLNLKTPATPPDSPTIVFTTLIAKTGSSVNTLLITKGILKHPPPSPTDNEFENFFQTGSYGYSTLLNPQGITIEWTDENGKKWSTLSGDQSASSFNIIEVNKKYVSGVTVLDTRCSFSCTVYDVNNSPKTISLGDFYGAFKNN